MVNERVLQEFLAALSTCVWPLATAFSTLYTCQVSSLLILGGTWLWGQLCTGTTDDSREITEYQIESVSPDQARLVMDGSMDGRAVIGWMGEKREAEIFHGSLYPCPCEGTVLYCYTALQCPKVLHSPHRHTLSVGILPCNRQMRERRSLACSTIMD
jgi:hypothetical protein